MNALAKVRKLKTYVKTCQLAIALRKADTKIRKTKSTHIWHILQITIFVTIGYGDAPSGGREVCHRLSFCIYKVQFPFGESPVLLEGCGQLLNATLVPTIDG